MIEIMFAIEAAGESNRGFLERLYHQYNRLMFYVAHQYFSKHQDCEDVVQDAVVQLCKKVDLLKKLPQYALPAYVNCTTKHMAIDHLRHQSIVDKHEEISTDDYMEAEISSPFDYAELAELKNDLRDVWERLPQQDQELLYRKYVFGEDNTELAEIFHCKVETIRMRLSRARKRAVDLIKEAKIYDKA